MAGQKKQKDKKISRKNASFSFIFLSPPGPPSTAGPPFHFPNPTRASPIGGKGGVGAASLKSHGDGPLRPRQRNESPGSVGVSRVVKVVFNLFFLSRPKAAPNRRHNKPKKTGKNKSHVLSMPPPFPGSRDPGCFFRLGKDKAVPDKDAVKSGRQVIWKKLK
jgi:hypothetical protein